MKESAMKKSKPLFRPAEREAIHAMLDEILTGGDPTEVLLVIILLIGLYPVSQPKARNEKRAARTAAIK
jgi:hypothetical protein